MGLDDTLADRQAQACTATGTVARAFGAVEALEQPRQLVGFYPGAESMKSMRSSCGSSLSTTRSSPPGSV